MRLVIGSRKAVVHTIILVGFTIGAIALSGVHVKFLGIEIGRPPVETCSNPEVVHAPAPMNEHAPYPATVPDSSI
ncbi:hypothetical protein AB0E59_06180 [Lentzea sp. NPDC034063]|uniref:hypothetical protein n=1 Tax=unclassified Lentzea TaxID=2643253 RepID=UPI00340B5AA9